MKKHLLPLLLAMTLLSGCGRGTVPASSFSDGPQHRTQSTTVTLTQPAALPENGPQQAAPWIPVDVPLARCAVASATPDAQFGTWTDTGGIQYEDALRFWVANRPGYTNTEAMEFRLEGSAITISGTFTTEASTESGATVSLNLYADGTPVYMSPSVAPGQSISVAANIRGADILRVECVTDVPSQGYGLLWASLTLDPDIPFPGYGKVRASQLCSYWLRPDGTVAFAGLPQAPEEVLSGWTCLTDLSVSLTHAVGLRSDGTVVSSREDLSHWRDITAVAAGENFTLGLKADGTLVVQDGNCSHLPDATQWTDITAIAAGSLHGVGLRSDGTVVAAGDNSAGQCDVAHWRNVVAVAAGFDHTLGLTQAGTVLYAGNPEYRQDVDLWWDIRAIAAGGSNSYALRSDGTVTAAGPFARYIGIPDWTNIVAIAGHDQLLGITSEGRILAAGGNQGGECDTCRLQPECGEHPFLDESGRCVSCGQIPLP